MDLSCKVSTLFDYLSYNVSDVWRLSDIYGPKIVIRWLQCGIQFIVVLFFVHKVTQALSGAMYFTGSVLFRVGCREFLQLLSCIGICVRFLHFFDFFFVFVLFLLADNSQVNLTCVKCVLEIPVLYPLVVDALADHMTKFLFDQSNRNIDALVKRPYRRYSEAFSFGM